MASAPPLKVLVLGKRQYMGRDLLDERYGRFRELPMQLANAGHHVAGLCLSYRRRAEGAVVDSEDGAVVPWTSLNLARLADPGARGYWRTARRIADSLQPDLVWACSDAPHAMLGRRLARRLGCRLVIDLYDNFEGYSSARIPGFVAGLHWALRGADGIGCVSAPLMRRIAALPGVRAQLAVIENAIPAGSFAPRDRAQARARFGLPGGAFLVGTAGSLSPTRGIDVLFAAFERFRREQPDARLVLAGPLDPAQALPEGEHVHYLGQLPPQDVPWLLAALDVSVVCNRDSEFGRYCFPQKLYESLACGLPVAVARIGAMAELLDAHPYALYEPGDPVSLAHRLVQLRANPRVPPLEVPRWQAIAARLERLFRAALAAPGA